MHVHPCSTQTYPNTPKHTHPSTKARTFISIRKTDAPNKVMRTHVHAVLVSAGFYPEGVLVSTTPPLSTPCARRDSAAPHQPGNGGPSLRVIHARLTRIVLPTCSVRCGRVGRLRRGLTEVRARSAIFV